MKKYWIICCTQMIRWVVVLRWAVFTILNNSYNFKWFITKLNDLHYLRSRNYIIDILHLRTIIFKTLSIIDAMMTDCYHVEWSVHCVKWFALGWMICSMLKDLNSVEWSVYYVEWFVQRWKICTALNALYSVECFVLRWITRITFNDLYYVEWLALTWIMKLYNRHFIHSLNKF